jgi:hypothetical protein
VYTMIAMPTLLNSIAFLLAEGIVDVAKATPDVAPSKVFLPPLLADRTDPYECCNPYRQD